MSAIIVYQKHSSFPLRFIPVNVTRVTTANDIKLHILTLDNNVVSLGVTLADVVACVLLHSTPHQEAVHCSVQCQLQSGGSLLAAASYWRGSSIHSL